MRGRACAVVLCLALAFSAEKVSALSVHSQADGATKITLTLEFKLDDLKFDFVEQGGRRFIRFNASEGLNHGSEGYPDLVRVHRWIAVDSEVGYQAQYQFSDPIFLPNMDVYPVQPDPIDDGRKLPFEINRAAYRMNRWFGAEPVRFGRVGKLGSIAVRPIEITPMQYNPRLQTVRIYQKVVVTVTAKARAKSAQELLSPPPSEFLAGQLEQLTVNGKQLLMDAGVDHAANHYLIISPAEYMSFAKQIGDHWAEFEGVSASYAEFPSGGTTAKVKEIIQAENDRAPLSHVLLLGDAKKIPLYKLSGYSGDAYYSFIDGNDSIADIGLGRLPVANALDAQTIVNKLMAYRRKVASGHVAKKVMLIAHREGAPSKYQGNMDQVKALPNPLGLEFNLQYGAKGASNDTVLDEASKDYAIVNYRGHGGSTTWSGWGSNGASFGFSQVDKLPATDTALSFVFNVACYNGTIQNSSPPLAYKLLFPTKDPSSLQGAVATFGASAPSLTEVNHRFNVNLFKYLQESSQKDIGSLYALANNKLVQDAGGSAPANVKMYMLFSDPMLRPWVN